MEMTWEQTTFNMTWQWVMKHAGQLWGRGGRGQWTLTFGMAFSFFHFAIVMSESSEKWTNNGQ